MGKFHNQDGPDSSDTLLRQGGFLDPFLLGPRMLKLCTFISTFHLGFLFIPNLDSVEDRGENPGNFVLVTN